MALAQVVDVGRIRAHIHPAIVGEGIAGRIRIALEAGEGKLVLIDAEPLFIREEFPGEGNGLFFEIIAQRPIAQHFEEGAMGGVAYLVDIAGAHALLHIRQPHARRVLRAHEIGHQRMHARRSKKYGRVVFRNEGGGRNNGVALLPEKLQI